MNKLTLSLLVSIVLTTAAQASLFDGFYIGGELGWVQREDTFSIGDAKFPDPQFPRGQITLYGAKGNKKTSGVGYGIFAGYGKNCHGLYLGAEVSIENDTASKNISHTPNAPVAVAGGAPEKGQAHLRIKYERGIVAGFAPRVGVVFANDNLLYARLGVQYSRDRIKGVYDAEIEGADYNERFSLNKTRAQFTIVPGIGYERAFGKILVRLEYNYNVGEKIKFSNNSSIKFTSHAVKFGLIYKF